jgi:hypothetical protein
MGQQPMDMLATCCSLGEVWAASVPAVSCERGRAASAGVALLHFHAVMAGTNTDEGIKAGASGYHFGKTTLGYVFVDRQKIYCNQQTDRLPTADEIIDLIRGRGVRRPAPIMLKVLGNDLQTASGTTRAAYRASLTTG